MCIKEVDKHTIDLTLPKIITDRPLGITAQEAKVFSPSSFTMLMVGRMGSGKSSRGASLIALQLMLCARMPPLVPPTMVYFSIAPTPLVSSLLPPSTQSLMLTLISLHPLIFHHSRHPTSSPILPSHMSHTAILPY